jgi:hypothetical protein
VVRLADGRAREKIINQKEIIINIFIMNSINAADDLVSRLHGFSRPARVN